MIFLVHHRHAVLGYLVILILHLKQILQRLDLNLHAHLLHPCIISIQNTDSPKIYQSTDNEKFRCKRAAERCIFIHVADITQTENRCHDHKGTARIPPTDIPLHMFSRQMFLNQIEKDIYHKQYRDEKYAAIPYIRPDLPVLYRKIIKLPLQGGFKFPDQEGHQHIVCRLPQAALTDKILKNQQNRYGHTYTWHKIYCFNIPCHIHPSLNHQHRQHHKQECHSHAKSLFPEMYIQKQSHTVTCPVNVPRCFCKLCNAHYFLTSFM